MSYQDHKWYQRHSEDGHSPRLDLINSLPSKAIFYCGVCGDYLYTWLSGDLYFPKEASG